LPEELPYDHLILALGAVSNYFGNQNIEGLAFDFKSLLDAIRIRNHVVDCFEYADRATEAAKRQELLTFVVAGGGFACVELAGALNDFARGMLADYPNLRAEELRIILVHARDRRRVTVAVVTPKSALLSVAARAILAVSPASSPIRIRRRYLSIRFLRFGGVQRRWSDASAGVVDNPLS
jgi:Pyridine nucleotide-disulphide oxidoreductase